MQNRFEGKAMRKLVEARIDVDQKMTKGEKLPEMSDEQLKEALYNLVKNRCSKIKAILTS